VCLALAGVAHGVPIHGHEQELAAAAADSSYMVGPFSKKKVRPSEGKLKGATLMDGKLVGGNIVGRAPQALLDAFKNTTTKGTMAAPLDCAAAAGLSAIQEDLKACEAALDWMKSTGFKQGPFGVQQDQTVLRLDQIGLGEVYPRGCLTSRKVQKMRARNGNPASVSRFMQVMFNAAGDDKCAQGCAESVGRLCKSSTAPSKLR